MSQALALRDVARANQGERELFPSVMRQGDGEKKCQNRANTRENGQIRVSTLLSFGPSARAHSLVLSGSF